MLFSIDTGSPDPIYLQLERQLRSAILCGRLQQGEKLSSHRELAAALVVNHLTIKRAYDELEREGLLTTRRGLGTFVVDTLPASLRASTIRLIAEDLHRAAGAAQRAGLDTATWNSLCATAWRPRS
jgi:GntR family transcriptional regulator